MPEQKKSLAKCEADKENPKSTAKDANPIGTSSLFEFPGYFRNAWNDFMRKKEQKDVDAGGFVLFDNVLQSNQPKKSTNSAKKDTVDNGCPRWTGIVAFGIGIIMLVIFLVSAFSGSSSLFQGIFDAKDNVFVDWDVEYRVAFIGNAYLYVNDIPRLMEAISEGHIQQNSCLNTGGSLSKLLRAGNGMYNYWDTEAASVATSLNYTYEFIDEDYVLFDYGACSVYQLLEGYDNDLAYQNYNGAYYDDGSNPCFEDEYYLGLVSDRLSSQEMYYWDFVVLNDQTKRMVFENARVDTIDALVYAYSYMIRDAHAIPIIVDTHAFWSEKGNMTGIDDITSFTADIYQGLREYFFALKYNLPETLTPRIAPVGLAYLTVYDENRELWEKLFLDDQIHSSLGGSYLFACVLYTTIYGHLPRNVGALGGMQTLFERSRDVQDNTGYPDNREANYLRLVAKRVVLDGYVPQSLKYYTEIQFNLANAKIDQDEQQFYSNGYNTQVDWDDNGAD